MASTSLVLTTAQFAAWAMPLRGALDSLAIDLVGPDGEDAVSKVYAWAMNPAHLTRFDAATGVEGLAKWMRRLVENACSFSRRQQARDRQLIEDLRWERLTGEEPQASLDDICLLAEAKLRLRITDLTDLQFACFADRVEGEKAAYSAARLEISVESVYAHVAAAVKKLRAAPIEVLEEPDEDAWYLRSTISAQRPYHSLPKMGGRLAREKLAKMK